jgi:hypothetical protein
MQKTMTPETRRILQNLPARCEEVDRILQEFAALNPADAVAIEALQDRLRSKIQRGDRLEVIEGG